MNSHGENQRTDLDDDRSSPPELVWENEGGHLRQGLHEDITGIDPPTPER